MPLPKMPKRPPLTMFTQPVENVTMYSNVQRWLMNTSMNIPQVYGPEARDILRQGKPEAETTQLLAAEIRQLSDLREVADPKRTTAYVLAPGASLTKYKLVLASLKETGYIIASPTVLPWLMKQAHVAPDLVMVVDGNWLSAELIRDSGVVEDSEAMLLMTPEAPPQIPAMFGQYRTHWIRTAIPGPDGSMDWEPYSIFQGFLGGVIEYRLAQLGCVTNMMVSGAMSLRNHAGWAFDQIVLLGADYGYWRGFARVPWDGSATLMKYDKARASNFKCDGLMTDRRMARYKASLLMVWLQTRERIYTMSHGILAEFPRVTEKQAIEGRFPKYPDWEETRTAVIKWLNWFREDSGLVQGVEESGLKERAYQVTFTEDSQEAVWAIVTAADSEEAIQRARGVTRATDQATAACQDLGPANTMSLTKELEEVVR